MSGALRGDEAPRARVLRTIAERWPGALREAQITAPARYEARIAALGEATAVTRRDWSAIGLAAVPLWCDLHGLLGDVARMRRAAEPFAVLEPDRRACWPRDPGRWPAELVRVDARFAVAWLAAVAGTSPAALDTVLRGG